MLNCDWFRYAALRSRLICLLSTNGVNTNPPPVRAKEDTTTTSHLSNTLVPRGGRGGRGGGRVTRRGLPGRGGVAGRGGGNASDRKGKSEEIGKTPPDWKKFKDTSGNEVCVKFNKEEGCPEGYGGTCGKKPRVRQHLCATVVGTNPLQLCLERHSHQNCPKKV